MAAKLTRQAGLLDLPEGIGRAAVDLVRRRVENPFYPLPNFGSRPNRRSRRERREEERRREGGPAETDDQQRIADVAAALGLNVGQTDILSSKYGIEADMLKRRVRWKYEELTGKKFKSLQEFLSSPEVINNADILQLAVDQVLGVGSAAQTIVRPYSSREPGLGVLRVPTAAYAQAASVGVADRHLRYLIDKADRAGVPWQLVWGIIRAESNWNPAAVGDGGTSHGLAQIHLPAHPDVTVYEARNPRFAIDWTITNLRKHFAVMKDWGLAALAHNSPAAAMFLYENGYSASGRARLDRQYLSRVFAGLDELGYGLGPEGENTTATAEYIESVGEVAGDAIPIPDRSALRQNAEQLIRTMFFREPSQGELDRLVGGLVDAIVNSYRRQIRENNPFKDQAADLHARTGGRLLKPVPGGKYTDSFGDPRDGGRRSHHGIDIFAPEGTPVYAAASGVVLDLKPDRLGGVVVRIQGDDGLYYYYAHLKEGSVKVREGQPVQAGTQIAEVGNTGNAKGTPFHLHFGIYEKRGGRPIDPFPLLQGATEVPMRDPREGSLQFEEDVDPMAHFLEQLRQTEEYRQLYGKKPSYLTEEEYSSQFRRVGEEMVGVGWAPGEAIRFGMERADPLVTAGYIAGREGATSRSRTFRERLFETVARIQNTI